MEINETKKRIFQVMNKESKTIFLFGWEFCLDNNG